MRSSKGFTLLEVLVAMTITAMALGSLYAVIAGNKRLAWRAEAALATAVEVRSHINYAQLLDQQGDVVVGFDRRDTLQLNNDEAIEAPKRKTWATASDLRRYEWKDAHGETVASGTYWIRQALPQNANGQQGGVGRAQTDNVPGAAPSGLQPPGPGRGRLQVPSANGQFPGGNQGFGPGASSQRQRGAGQ